MKRLLFLAALILTACHNQTNQEKLNEIIAENRIKNNNEKKELVTEVKIPTLRDTLDMKYQKLGFANFCDVVAEDDILYIEAATKAGLKYPNNDNQRMDYELMLYKKNFAKWAKKRKINKNDFENDKLDLVWQKDYYCGQYNKNRLEVAREKIKRELGLIK